MIVYGVMVYGLMAKSCSFALRYSKADASTLYFVFQKTCKYLSHITNYNQVGNGFLPPRVNHKSSGGKSPIHLFEAKVSHQ